MPASLEGMASRGQAGQALILVVERDPYVRELEHYFLEQAGYAIEFCTDGAAGLARVQASPPDILITEILIAGLDGLSVCRAIKANPATRHVVVLVFSILAAEDRAIEAGADAFLRKPLNETRLLGCVERLLATSAGGGGRHGAHQHRQ